MPYTNPILAGSNPDPSIIRVGKDYFLTTSTFEYTPSAPIYHSTDLIKWALIGHALTRPSQLTIQTPEPGGGVWATTLRYHKGVFYITAASFTRYRPQDDDRVWPRGFVVRTRDIWDESSWSEPVWFDAVGFDQDLFFDDDGTVYLSSTYRKHPRTTVPAGSPALKDFAIHICTIDIETGTATSPSRLIRSSDSGVSEGSHIFKRNGLYYLFTAEGGTESGHCEWVFRSEKGPFGPWEVGPRNPLWRNGVHDEVQNTGHADFVEDQHGEWWAVLLGVRPVWREDGEGGRWEGSVFGRETFLVPVTWENDWPVINSGNKITLTIDTPHLYHYTPPISWFDDFTSQTMQMGWYRKNTPLKKDYTILPLSSLPENASWKAGLRLHGAPYTLSSPACPTLFLRKQESRSCLWETKLRFSPTLENAEAGTAVYLNYFTHVSIGLRLAPDSQGDEEVEKRRIVQFTATAPKRNSSAATLSPTLTLSNSAPLHSHTSDVLLYIECGDSYRFGFKEILDAEPDSEPITWFSSIPNSILTEAPLPIGAPFTGIMLGLYSCGDRQAVLEPADFEFVRVREVGLDTISTEIQGEASE
ncbi:glycoside hydrolase family 43 protein [Aspergillus stella-maris]|uniref:glycoside hydrolase family 43 protein n=1 Tax=Aspergillus stella-maris TaxID=1810926 RepID=UPI003CCD23AC